MSSRFKSRIPERVRNSLTVLDGPNSRISRIRDAALPSRSSLSRSHMPLPISNTLSGLVKPVSPKAVFKKTLTEEDAVIRSLVRRSKPLAVRGNRTSFRRIQLAHAAPIGDSPVLLKANDSFCSADFRLQKPIKEAIPADPEKDPAASRTAKSLLDLVAGRRQPGMEQMRFLCSDHRLINVPTPLMYRHSRIMSHLEMEVQPIPLRSIRSVTLLRVIMWMHKKTLCANGNEKVAEATPTVETFISDIREGNGNASSETSCQISEITQEIKTGEDELIIERGICCSRSEDNIVIHANVMQNFCKRCGIIRCAGDNANDDQCVADLNEMKRSSYLLCSWEERLLGNELYQLVEIILASHYLGIESLTMNAIHHFCELMAQRTRSECCLMLRIKTRLAGDNHCPLIRESLSLGCHRNNQADGSESEEEQFEPNSRIARIFRKHRPNGRAAIGGGMGDGLYENKPRSRNH
ncbi:GD15915 [Drosophila simulans]|uniref:GD15915 n=1 Tax=Drosophila simulans TaxID=7240 RepID=B4R3Z9_DROSI|nr:GD15915 [Drosophila simulans]